MLLRRKKKMADITQTERKMEKNECWSSESICESKKKYLLDRKTVVIGIKYEYEYE